MGNLSLGGLVSGVNTDGIIQKLLDLENSRVMKQEARKAELETKRNVWREVRSSLSALRSKVDAIRFSSAFRARKATLSDDSVATVTAATGASLTAHTLSVSQLATAQVVAGTLRNKPTDPLGVEGPLQLNGKAIAVVASDNLYSLRDKINHTVGINASADVVQVMDGANIRYRLVLTSKATGVAGALQMPGVASSDPGKVGAAGTSASGTWTVTVAKLAQSVELESDGVDEGVSYSGSFTITTDTAAYKIDATAGANVHTLKSMINSVQSEVTADTYTDVTGTHLRLTAVAPGKGFSLTGDSGILKDIGIMGNDGRLKHETTPGQNAEYTINGIPYTSTSNVIDGLVDHPGLNLQLGSVTTGPVTVKSGLAQAIGLIAGDGSVMTELVPPKNAVFKLNGVSYEKPTNTITDVVPSLTITLKKAGNPSAVPPTTADTTITLTSDGDKVAGLVQDWVNALNSTMELLRRNTNYDADTKQAGILQGDALARSLQTSLRSALSNVVPGLPADLRQMSDIGITTGAYGTDDYGKILFDPTKFKSKLEADADGVARVFGSLRKNVALTGNGGLATSSSVGFDPGDPTKVFAAADAFNGETAGARFGSAGGGWQSGGVPDPNASPPTEEWLAVGFAEATIDQIQLYLPDTDEYKVSDGIKDYKLQYRKPDNSWETISTVTDNSSSVKILDFASVSTTAIRLLVTATYNGKPARVTELQVHQYNSGAALDAYRTVNMALQADGTLDMRDEGLSTQISAADKQIKRMSDSLVEREKRLREQFARMEAALSKLQSQGNALAGQLASLQSK